MRAFKTLAVIALLSLYVGSNRAYGGEISLTESQVKALFLLNFAKYVEWPSTAFAAVDAPIVIGVIGEGNFEGELSAAVGNKSVDGRSIHVRQLQTPQEWDTCHILFIRASKKAGLDEILGRIKTKPILTVGETDRFMEQGGAINFVKKEGKIRLEINLDAAQTAGVQISSKLLNVADAVKGRTK